MMKKFFAVAGLVLAGSLAGGILGPAEEAGAVSGSCYFGSTGMYDMKTGTCSTKTQYGDYLTNDVLRGRDVNGNGYAIPSTVNSKAAFISFIRGKFNSSYVQDKVGAAFIMQRMLGSRSWPTTASMNDWEARMNQSTVTFQSLTTSVTSSSWYDPNMQNVFFATRPSTSRSVIRIVQNGQVLIEIQRACANPTMAYNRPLLKPPQWRMSGSSTINRTTATPGQTVTWTHFVQNNGPDKTTQGIRTWSQLSGFSGSGWNGENDVRTATYARNQARTAFNRSSYTVSRSDVGRVLCQQVRWRATAHNNPGMGQGVNRCVTILPEPWSTVGASSRTVNNINTGTAAPGNIIRWTHTLRLQINSNHLPINSYTHATGFSNGWNGTSNSLNIAAWRPVGLIRTVSPGIASRTQHTVTQNDVGNDLCQRLMWSPSSNIAGSSGASTPACVYVPHNYELIPAVEPSRSDGSIVEPGDTVDVNSRIENVGSTKSRSSQWRLVEVVVGPSLTVPNPGGGSSFQVPCAYRPGTPGISCQEIASGTGVFNPNITALPTVSNRQIADLPVGTKVCWGLSVQARSHDDDRWQHSGLRCVSVGKKPKVQFLGSDVRSGNRVIAAPTQINSRYYGSWAEYAILSANQADSASGAAFSGPWDQGRSYTNPSRFNRLTFANVSPPYGHFPTSPTELPALFSSGGSSQPGSTVNPASLASGTYTYSAATLAIDGGELSNRVIIRSTGNVTINGNITYADGSLSNSNLPQLVIIARNIHIAQGVTEVNAWLVASGPGGVVNTCGTTNSYTGLSSNLCNAQLRINGPVIAQRLYLRRTAGGDTGSRNAPAEILNMRPDAYIWAQNHAGGLSSIKTMHIRELPPRF